MALAMANNIKAKCVAAKRSRSGYVCVASAILAPGGVRLVKLISREGWPCLYDQYYFLLRIIMKLIYVAAHHHLQQCSY